MKITDGLAGLVFIVLGAAIYWQASLFPTFSGQPYGAAFLPMILAVAFVIAGALLILRDLKARKTAVGQARTFFAFVPELRQRGLPALLAVLGTVMAQIFWGSALGFIPVSFAALSVLFLALKIRPWVALTMALATTIGCWIMFVSLLRVPLPRGILDGIL